MSQKTNLNVSPYFDDFNIDNNYYKVLFKPGYPVQARELTTQQSILQNQIEQFGTHIFKDGSVVIPGNLNYQNPVYAVEIEPIFNGVPISLYFDQLNGKKIRGQSTNVSAEIFFTITNTESERSNYTLYVKFIESGGENFDIRTFIDSETLTLEESLTFGNTTLQAGQGFCNTISQNSVSFGSFVSLAPGVYFVRGIFAKVQAQSLLLDQYGTEPSYKVGFEIEERVVNSFEDTNLNDNSQGFSNYAAPGADRFQLNLILTKKDIVDSDVDDFVEIFRVSNGIPTYTSSENSQYNLIRDELARRTFDESGNYIVKPFTLFVRDNLNDRYSTDGVYYAGQTTSNGNVPSEDLMVYQIGPGKAYVKGYDVESISSKLLDVPKARTTARVEDLSLNFAAGTLFVLNNTYGSAPVGLGTTAVVSLMSSRLGSNKNVAAGTTIGEARVYDYVPESSYQDDTSRMHLRLFDINTYTTVGLSTSITLTTPTQIKGKTSKATGFLRSDVTNSNTLTLYSVSGQFLDNERIIVNGIDSNRLITSVTDYSLNDVKSIYSTIGVSTFNSDLSLQNVVSISPAGTTFNVSGVSGGISTVTTGLYANFINVLKPGDIVRYANPAGGALPVYNEVNSVSAGGTFFTIKPIQSVTNICVGTISTVSFTTNNIVKITPEILNPNGGTGLISALPNENVESVDLESTSILQRRKFKNVSFSSNTITVTISDQDIFFTSFDEDRYLISYQDGTIEPIRFDKFNLDTSGKTITFNNVSKTSGVCEVIATIENLKPNPKVKKFNKASTLIVDKSSLTGSGIGTTTFDDGLTYSKIYGLRVQDEEISLNVPDVVRILGVFESSNSSDPQIPKIQLTSFSGPSSSNLDYNIGEIITGATTGAVGLIVSRVDSDKLEFCYLNGFSFSEGETIVGSETNTSSTILQSFVSDKNILKNYDLDNGQTTQIYDFSKIIRKPNTTSPKRKLKVVFQNYTIDSNDPGEFITVNSYPSDAYKSNIPFLQGVSCSDLIDNRPRVKPYDISSNRSPFEQIGKDLSFEGTNSSYNIVTDSNIILSYNYYLGRVDNVILNSDGTFEVVQGIPNQQPLPPKEKANSITIARVYIQPYVYSEDDVTVEMIRHRRYRMSDISLLEDRIERLEEYTTLTLSEMKTESLSIKDSETGLDRFKSGFFVDNFVDYTVSDLNDPQFRSEIGNGYCSPFRSSTFIPLQLGSEAIQGFGSTYDSKADQSYVTDLGSQGVRKSGDLITLDYIEVLLSEQNQATKSDDIGASNFWRGVLTLSPSEDNWYDERVITTKTYDTAITGVQPPGETVYLDPIIDWDITYVDPPPPPPPVSPAPGKGKGKSPSKKSSSSSSSQAPVYLTGDYIKTQFGGNADAALQAAKATGKKIVAGEGVIKTYGVDPKQVNSVVPPTKNKQTSLTSNPFY